MERRRSKACDGVLMASLVILGLGISTVSAQISWTPIYVDTSNRLDLWTVSSTGCECPDRKSSNCACCVKPGGCLCSFNPNKCSQCGLEDACQRFCNVTISSRTVATRSGLSWVHLKSPELEGPTSCWWRLHSAPGQRIEVQIHRIVSVGTYDNASQTCKDGFLQFADGDISTASTQAIQLCGQNSRYSPPVVMFGDQGMATLLLRLDVKSISSQILAYVSFSSADDATVGDPSRGGRLRPHSVCDWTYDNCWDNKCILASPGFPGLFPPHRRCRYFLQANSTTDKILVTFQALNIPPPPLCSSHHIAIWRRNVSSLAHLGPPWKTLCQHSETTVEIFGGQALIEFRSGSTTSPNLYNGFRASVKFIHTFQPPSPAKNFPTTTTTVATTAAAAAGAPFPPSQSPALSSEKMSHSGSKNPKALKERTMEEPLGNPRAHPHPTDGEEMQSVSCGQTITSGLEMKEKGFRLKIPKDLSSWRSSGGVGRDVKRPGSRSDVTVNSSRSLFIPFQCRIEFRGNISHVIRLALSSFKLRGSNCSSRVEVYDIVDEGEESNRTTASPTLTTTKGDHLIGTLCGPVLNTIRRFTSLHNNFAIVVVVEPNESPKGSEILEGSFRFHDESIEGTVKPLSSCDLVYYGVTTAAGSGSLAEGPQAYHLLKRLSPLPLSCSYSFHPMTNQSVVLTLDTPSGGGGGGGSGGPNDEDASLEMHSKNYCRTQCSTSGCTCERGESPLREIDHMRIVAGSTDLACLCGNFLDFLPLAFESHASLTLVHHSASEEGLDRLVGYKANYQFIPKLDCSNFTISPPNGWKRWREILDPRARSTSNQYFYYYTHYECSWTAKVSRKQRLSIDLVSEENERDCKAWNFTVWAQNDKFLNRSDLLSSFCPEEGRKEVKVPSDVRKAFIRLEGVSMRIPQFEVRWKYLDPNAGSNRLPERMMSSTATSSSLMISFPMMMMIPLVVILCLSPRLDFRVKVV